MSSSSDEIIAAAQAFCDQFNADYEAAHLAFEEQFWGTKMALASHNTTVYSAENLTATKTAMERLLADTAVRTQAETHLAAVEQVGTDAVPTTDLLETLRIIIRTVNCYVMPAAAQSLRESTAALESRLEMARNQMKLGYTLGQDFHEASSVGLRNKVRTDPSEEVRKAAYEGLRSIGPFVLANGFVEIIQQRNQMAKTLGYEDYYDYKVTNAEGFGKQQLFEMLDGLEKGTRPILQAARAELEARYGKDALEPWNTSYKMAGSIVAELDPYFPFGSAVERYVRSYHALGISYKGATMNLDLLDRPHKYSNGFCHWPQPAWKKSSGEWQPAVTNFTSLADPTAVGSGLTALRTLMHEAGHAAHFANIVQPSPLFSQERAPTSVAYAENQSMVLDSLVSDAAWRAAYARHGETGEPIPFALLEKEMRATHPFGVLQLRAMLAVSYFEKALYEMETDQITTESVKALADRIEQDIQGGFSARPLLSVPHLVSDEASCYYHGYTLAEMSVHQTRAFFKQRDGYIVDNPAVGPTLTTAYWQCGNARPFLDLVQELTGQPLSGDAWIASLQETVDDKVAREQQEYDESLQRIASKTTPDKIDLDMTVKFVDGDTVIADSTKDGILAACQEFEAFVAERVAAAAASS